MCIPEGTAQTNHRAQVQVGGGGVSEENYKALMAN